MFSIINLLKSKKTINLSIMKYQGCCFLDTAMVHIVCISRTYTYNVWHLDSNVTKNCSSQAETTEKRERKSTKSQHFALPAQVPDLLLPPQPLLQVRGLPAGQAGAGRPEGGGPHSQDRRRRPPRPPRLPPRLLHHGHRGIRQRLLCGVTVKCFDVLAGCRSVVVVAF